MTTDNQRFHRRRRAEVLGHLGGKCVRCNFDDPRALQVDHINSDGSQDRRNRSASAIRLAILRDEPGYQILCANCNWIKRSELGETRPVVAEHKEVVPGKGQINALKTHCNNGHPYNEENTYLNPSGSRACRTCHRARSTAWARTNAAKNR